MPASSKSDRSENSNRCTHLRADGKRCADVLYPGHSALCHHHLSQQMRGISDGNSIAADILSSVGNFQSASAINVVLGKLFIHQITGRISRRDAVALAYTCQLLLQTLKMVKSELQECGYNQWWREETSRILSGPSDLDEITDPALLPISQTSLHPPALTPEPSADVATARSASPPTPPTPPPPLPSSCSAGLQPSSASPSSSPSPAKPPQHPSSTPQSPPAQAAAPPNSAPTNPPVATPPPRPAGPTPPLPAAAPRTRPSAEVRCASRDAFPG